MRKPFSPVRPWLIGRAASDPAGNRPRFYASDLVLALALVLLGALLDIALRALG